MAIHQFLQFSDSRKPETAKELKTRHDISPLSKGKKNPETLKKVDYAGQGESLIYFLLFFFNLGTSVKQISSQTCTFSKLQHHK